MSEGVVYGLVDHFGKVRYIGFTSQPLERRLRDHINGSKYRRTYKDNWIQSLLAIGVEPTIKVIEEVESDWQGRERFWIDEFSQIENALTNLTQGGEGLLNPSPDVRQKLSDGQRAAWKNPERGKPKQKKGLAPPSAETRKGAKRYWEQFRTNPTPAQQVLREKRRQNMIRRQS